MQAIVFSETKYLSEILGKEPVAVVQHLAVNIYVSPKSAYREITFFMLYLAEGVPVDL
jgi:hypothetical protein